MNAGDRIILTEGAVVYDRLGADYLQKGTEGTIREYNGAMLVIETAKGTYDIPAASVTVVPEDAAA